MAIIPFDLLTGDDTAFVPPAGHSNKVPFWEQYQEPSLDTESISDLTLDVPASRSMRNKLVLSKYFVMTLYTG